MKGRQSRRVRQAGGNRSGNAAGCIYDSPTPRIRGKVSTQIVDSRILREPLNAPKNSSLPRHHECVMVVLSVISLVGVGFAAGPAPPWHTTIHAALALGFGLWAQRLRQGPGGSELQARLEALEAEVSKQELSETQEHPDFAEGLLAQGPEPISC